MKTFSMKMKLSRKILIVPMVILIFTLVLSVISYLGLTKQTVAIEDIFVNRFKGYQDSSRIMNDIANVQANTYKVLSWANAKYDEKKIDQLAKEQIAAIKQNLDFMKKILKSDSLLPEERRLYQSSLEKLIEYQKPAEGVLDIASSDINIATMYMGSCDDQFQVLSKELKSLLALEDALSQGRYALSQKSAQNVSRWNIVLLILVVALSIVISIFMGRLITVPIGKVIAGLSESACQVASASVQIASASQSLAEGASEQAAAIEETSSSIEEMASMSRQNADNASQANTLMGSINGTIENADRSMNELTESMKEITVASEETGKIIKTIDEIAFQTNLLALNAAVEAARAGEAGAGFAVVANEVRNLAMRAAEAAKNTSGLIEGTVKKVRHGSETVSKTNGEFAKVSEGAKKVKELVAEIAAASQEQAQGVDQINKAVAEMDKVVQRNAASAEESASASEEMNGQAEQVKEFVAELAMLAHGSGSGNGSKPALHAHVGAAPLPQKPMKTFASSPAAHLPQGRAAKRPTGPVKGREVSPEQVIPMEGSFEEF